MNSFSWIIWLIAVLGALSATRNPLHLILILLILGLMTKIIKYDRKDNLVPISFFPFFLLIILTAAVFNALLSHVGSTILFFIPGNVVLISGPITLEAIVYGATNGLILSGIFLSFSIFNQSLSAKTIIRMIPKAFYPLALIITIAINFLPSIRRRLEEIRQAQAIRGHQLRNIGDYASLFLPLLIDSLERSMQLAESMTSRGFVPYQLQSTTPHNRFVIITGMIFFIAGWIVQLSNGNHYAYGLSLLGLFMIIFWFLWISKQIPQSTYKREKWSWLDVIISVIFLSGLCVYIIPLPFIDHQILIYNAYPTIILPDFDIIVGCVSLCFLIPAFINRGPAHDLISKR